MQAQPGTRLGRHPRGETCHARRFDTLDAKQAKSARPAILAGKDAMRVVLILWILRPDDTSEATVCRHNRTLPWAGILPGQHAMRDVLILWIVLTRLAMLLDAGTTEHSPGQASSRGNMPCASF
jgi:hypothetical protein